MPRERGVAATKEDECDGVGERESFEWSSLQGMYTTILANIRKNLTTQ